MRKIIYKIVYSLILFFCICTLAYCNDFASDKVFDVNCSPNQKTCHVGDRTMHSSNGQPLSVFDGIVCLSTMKLCTNGFRLIRYSQPLTIPARSVVCSQDKKWCTIGKYMMHSINYPLYVADGVVCTNNKKNCTNGLVYKSSSVPMYK